MKLNPLREIADKFINLYCNIYRIKDEDDVRDIILEVYEKLEKLFLEGIKNIPGYINVLVKNVCLNKLNEIKRRGRIILIGDDLDKKIIIENNDEYYLIDMSCAVKISMLLKFTKERERIWYFVSKFYSNKEIAKILKKKPSIIKVQKSKILKTIKDYIIANPDVINK